MKLIIDFTNKTVEIPQDAPIQEVFEQLEKIVPKEEWKNWKMKTERTTEYYPIYPSYPYYRTYPWWDGYYWRYDTTGGTVILGGTTTSPSLGVQLTSGLTTTDCTYTGTSANIFYTSIAN